MVFMSTLLQRQVVQELADTRVLGAARCPFVEPAGFDLNGAGLLSNRFQPERTAEPYGLAIYKAFHILAADQRYVLSELLAVERKQPLAMSRLICAHCLENSSRAGKALAQSLGKIGIDPFILFFERNCQGQDFAFAQAVERLHADHLSRSSSSGQSAAITSATAMPTETSMNR